MEVKGSTRYLRSALDLQKADLLFNFIVNKSSEKLIPRGLDRWVQQDFG